MSSWTNSLWQQRRASSLLPRGPSLVSRHLNHNPGIAVFIFGQHHHGTDFATSVQQRTLSSARQLRQTTPPIPSFVNPPRPRASNTATGFTASDAFFEGLWELGVKACFVNLGSDHPSLIEAMLKGQQKKDRFPEIYTCPNEMVAVSMADGWARATGSPQAVIVHVDVGTQAVGQAMHNANTGRVPVFIFAGLTPYSEEGFKASRTEYQHWLQDAPDQKAIVRDYCRYTGDLRTGSTVKQTVARAMQIASSDPKGPVYLTGAREVMAQKIETNFALESNKYGPIGPAALPKTAVQTITETLVHAKAPIVITGRNHSCPAELVRLAESIPGLRVLDTGGCDMCFPAGHPSYGLFRLGFHQATTKADVILVLDCDVPWIPSQNPPRKDAKIYHVDIDPLNTTIGLSFYPTDGRWKADNYTALCQLNEHLATTPALQKTLQSPIYKERWGSLVKHHVAKNNHLSKLATPPANANANALDIHQIGAIIRKAVPEETVYVVEAATCAMDLSDQLQVDIPGSWINSGGAGLGWSGGAALGVKLAYDSKGSPKFICQVAGDGVFLFSVPSSVYWIASKYNIPILTVVLNNRGWNAPRRSYEFVHPDGLGATATNQQMHISFNPSPDYGGIAKAAAGAKFGTSNSDLFVGKATTATSFNDLLIQGVQAVLDGRGALVEAVLSVDEMGDSTVQSIWKALGVNT
ncbi:Benzoylformate decarboxylase [Lachnellula arida]|uniref:Benzoylformate decarboxylase n=1 Tax=Lachnellula arida TaxID=1316785 RepID=A0A8T9BL86_9HELO|nr:Benzoylformate decarboxylase [Lachnellula arida]